MEAENGLRKSRRRKKYPFKCLKHEGPDQFWSKIHSPSKRGFLSFGGKTTRDPKHREKKLLSPKRKALKPAGRMFKPGIGKAKDELPTRLRLRLQVYRVEPSFLQTLQCHLS